MSLLINANKFLKTIVAVIFALVFVFNVYAVENGTLTQTNASLKVYYADIIIDVEENGIVDITGTTNYPKFQNVANSQDFTSKDGKMWTLEVNSDEKFETFIFEANLPENANINYIKTTPTFRISNEDGKIKIIGTGENKPFTLIVQYEIEFRQLSFFKQNFELLLFIILIVLVILTIIATYIITTRVVLDKKIAEELGKIEHMQKGGTNDNGNITMMSKSKVEDAEEEVKTEEKKPPYDYNILPQRQKDIIDILREKGKITQKELETIMEIPKSSVSRNVRTLEIKGIVKKESVGQTNYLSVIE